MLKSDLKNTSSSSSASQTPPCDVPCSTPQSSLTRFLESKAFFKPLFESIDEINSRLLIFLLLLLPFGAKCFDASGLEISLAGDMIYDQGLNQTSAAEEKLTMRGAELMFYAPLDHNFEGILSAAAHEENGENLFELHELYISSSKIIPRSRFKLGRFFLGIGRLNKVHQHDWPFIRAPTVHTTFFDTEGVFDSGAEFSYLAPLPFYLDITAGLTSGYRYGHSHTAGSKPKVPTHYLRLETFKSFSSTDGAQLAFNYLGRTDEQSNQTILPGLELVMKWREGKRLLWLTQSEVWYQKTLDINESRTEQAGLYLFNQYGLSARSLLGFRLDLFKNFSKVNSLTLKKINNIEYGFAPEFTWKSSEFVTLRGGLSHTMVREEGVTTEKDTRLELQAVFILGSHPAHQF